MEQTRFEDFVGLISLISKEVQRIKAGEAARLGIRGSDVMSLYYLGRHEEGLTGAELAREADLTRAAVSRSRPRGSPSRSKMRVTLRPRRRSTMRSVST